MHTSYNYPKQLITEYRETVRDSIPGELPDDVRCFLNFIVEHLYDDALTVADAINTCKIKSKNFTSRFSFYIGATPKKFILEHRINTAKLLFQETELSVAHVSILVGFSTHSAFSKAFKSGTDGVNPSDWRGHNSRKNSRKNSG
ncbi:MAG: AraC family transcriptional regulator [Gracilimonas sp.]|nr:AraC family transcriptional regulator [Gracilimonas sp.]